MVATVAVLSDIHGVLPALEAVPAEPDVREADVGLTGGRRRRPAARTDARLLDSLGDRVQWVNGSREFVAQAHGT